MKNLAHSWKFSEIIEQKTEYKAIEKQYECFLNYAKRSYNNYRIQWADNKLKEALKIINRSIYKVC